MDTRNRITIHDVAADLGLELSHAQAWRIGDAVKRIHRWDTGELPVKDNRTKKAGTGSHCFALYPDTAEWRERIARQIRTVRAEEPTTQTDLFATPPSPSSA
jgi:hypothetical protein